MHCREVCSFQAILDRSRQSRFLGGRFQDIILVAGNRKEMWQLSELHLNDGMFREGTDTRNHFFTYPVSV